jgi:uncharacterized protein YndB with AHSA1/START domain
MRTDLHFEFTVDKQNNSITVEREFAAERNLVWDAYTKSEILDQWWAPKPFKSKTKSMDFRIGGHWHYAMVGPDGTEHYALANFKDISPKNSFAVEDVFADAEGNVNKDMPASAWQLSFSDKGDNTLLRILIVYPDLSQLEETIKMGFKEGLSAGMENLDALLPKLKK